MIETIRRLTAIFLILSLAACCSFAVNKTVLTRTDDGKKVTVRIGDLLDIVLDENPTTGFRWVSASSAPAAIMVCSPSEFTAESRLIGAGGKRTIHFKAVKKGKEKLMFAYRRTWENKPPARTFRVTVTVK